MPHVIRWKVASRRRLRDAISALYGVGAGTFEQILEGRESEGFEMESDAANVIDETFRMRLQCSNLSTTCCEALLQQATDI